MWKVVPRTNDDSKQELESDHAWIEYFHNNNYSLIVPSHPQLKLYEEKLRKLRKELQKVQDLNCQSQEEARNYETRFNELGNKLSSTGDKHRHAIQEVTMREEQLVVLKVEGASLKEKLRQMNEEVCTECPPAPAPAPSCMKYR